MFFHWQCHKAGALDNWALIIEVAKEVFMVQPPGFESSPPQVCRLHKSLYGLKQAPRA